MKPIGTVGNAPAEMAASGVNRRSLMGHAGAATAVAMGALAAGGPR